MSDGSSERKNQRERNKEDQLKTKKGRRRDAEKASAAGITVVSLRETLGRAGRKETWSSEKGNDGHRTGGKDGDFSGEGEVGGLQQAQAGIHTKRTFVREGASPTGGDSII